jgi:hypothetical protein
MATLFKKYEFNTKEQAESKIADLPHIQDENGNDIPNHNHCIVKLGNLWETKPVYDQDGETINEGIKKTLFAVDVLWDDLESSPYGWKTYEVTPEGNGVHTFAGFNFQ